MMKKTQTLFLAVLCALSMLTGCKDKGASQETQGSSVQGNNRWRTMVVKRSDTEVKRGQTLFTIDAVPYRTAFLPFPHPLGHGRMDQLLGHHREPGQTAPRSPRLQFQHSLLNAGAEVNNALTQAQTYADKSSHLENQVKALERTVKSTHLLQQNGSSNYLEVLTAQENLLSAQMSQLQNIYNKVAAQIALYQAMP